MFYFPQDSVQCMPLYLFFVKASQLSIFHVIPHKFPVASSTAGRFALLENLLLCFIRNKVQTKLLDPLRAGRKKSLCVCCGNPFTYLHFLEGRKKTFSGNCSWAGCDPGECQTKREWLAACYSNGIEDLPSVFISHRKYSSQLV